MILYKLKKSCEKKLMFLLDDLFSVKKISLEKNLVLLV